MFSGSSSVDEAPFEASHTYVWYKNCQAPAYKTAEAKVEFQVALNCLEAEKNHSSDNEKSDIDRKVETLAVKLCLQKKDDVPNGVQEVMITIKRDELRKNLLSNRFRKLYECKEVCGNIFQKMITKHTLEEKLSRPTTVILAARYMPEMLFLSWENEHSIFLTQTCI